MSLSIDDIHVFADGLDHTECVAVHPDGSVWAGGEAGQIYRISPDGSVIDEVANSGGFILGIAFSPDASWLAVCDLKNKCVWKLLLKNFSLEKFATGTEETAFSIPNYPVFDRSGRLYVSDSGSFRQINGRIFRFEDNGVGQIWHKGPFNFANGMALSADQTFLYVVCTWLPGVERITINADRSAGTREVFITIPGTCPDGVALDMDGNVYVSCYAPNAIYLVDAERRVDLLVDDWEGHTLSNPTNIAFGGEDFSHLFIANLGRWHISKTQMKAKGLPLTDI